LPRSGRRISVIADRATGMLREPSEGLLDELRATVGSRGWAVPEPGSAYLTEPRGWRKGRAAIALKPASTNEAARIVALCAAERVGIVPYGGGTGLVGGQVADTSPTPIVLSLERMRAIRNVVPEDDAIVVEAGCRLGDVHAEARKHGRIFPLYIASSGTCRIGGNLATNAGGTQALRYGSARDLCLGIEAVLANGQVWSRLRSLRKESCGYDLRHLLVGAEGTLGIITAASLRLFPAPAESAAAIAATPDPESATRLALQLRNDIAETLSSIELMERSGLDFVRRHLPDVPLPLPGEHPWYVLIDVEGGVGSCASQRLEAALAKALDAGVLLDATLALGHGQRDAMHNLRESIPVANKAVGAIATHDISVPLPRIPEFARAFRAICEAENPPLRSNVFGHLGDGNLHANIFPPEDRRAVSFRNRKTELNGAVFDLVRRFEGAVSAEHGVGRALKAATVGRLPSAERELMRTIKKALDPLGILNPGAVIDMEEPAT